ncbi:Synaptobrevin-like protein [Schistosoma japonicum]|nr:Synaptobrevin-like protein [Schistosoma japonicum]
MTDKVPIKTNKRLQQTQAQVNEVVDIMRVNVDKVLERDKNLSELDGRADALQAGASQFEASAGKLKRKLWWKNCKAEHDETSSHSRLMSNSSHSLPEPVMIVENSGRGKPALPYPIMQLTEPGDEAPFFDSSRINSNRSEKLHSPSSLSSQSSSAFSSFPQSQHHFKNNDTFLF